MRETFSGGSGHFHDSADPGEGVSIQSTDLLMEGGDVLSSNLGEAVEKCSHNYHVWVGSVGLQKNIACYSKVKILLIGQNMIQWSKYYSKVRLLLSGKTMIHMWKYHSVVKISFSRQNITKNR